MQLYIFVTASIAPIATPIGAVFAGSVLERLGRKTTLLIINIPGVIGWLLIAFAYGDATLILIYIGRFIAGNFILQYSTPKIENYFLCKYSRKIQCSCTFKSAFISFIFIWVSHQNTEILNTVVVVTRVLEVFKQSQRHGKKIFYKILNNLIPTCCFLVQVIITLKFLDSIFQV